MPITLTPTATGHAFSRNPILLSMTGTGQRVFTIYGQGYTKAHPAYMGEVTAPAVINLAEFIDAIIPAINDPGNQDEIIAYGLQDGTVTIEVDDGSQEPTTWQIIAHKGGISKQNFRKYSLAGTDVFAARFLNPACNFFLTSRTHDWRLNIKETELYPLVFFYPPQGTLTVIDVVSENTVSIAATQDGVDYHGKLCSLDLKAVRRYFLEQYAVMANVFDILANDTPAARIGILESRPQRELYRLKFRNSYGVFEIVEITGTAQLVPVIAGEDDAKQYKCYKADIDDFSTERNRTELSNVIKVSTGYKTNNELRFLLDAITSDEIYLLDLTHEPIKVIATANELAYFVRPNGPQTFDLELTPVEDEACITTELDAAVSPSRGGLFSEEYSEHFN